MRKAESGGRQDHLYRTKESSLVANPVNQTQNHSSTSKSQRLELGYSITPTIQKYSDYPIESFSCGEKTIEVKGGCRNVSNSKNTIKEQITESGEGNDDVYGRLEVIQLSSREPDLSEEQLRVNDQLQEDELLALESIYGENVHILDRQRGQRFFQIHIHIDTPGEISITAKLKSSSELEIKKTNSDDFTYSFKVKYLHPIVLTCLLPKSYPSHLPPYYTISVPWLDSARISDLCSMLDTLWTAQIGQEVLYQWVDWLHIYSLAHLQLENEISLDRYGVRTLGDKRAISGSVSPEVDIPAMKNYDNQRRDEYFRKNLHECSICLSQHAGTTFIRLPCKHYYCCKCMEIYANMHVKEGTVSKIKCPDAKCEIMVPPGILKQLLGDEEFDRWDSMLLTKTLESMSDVAYCPRCETPCIEDENHDSQCSKCFFTFCTLCKERRHVGIECMTPEMKLQFLQERQNSSQLNGEQRRKEREMINELLSVKEILRDAKQCPSCKMAISRTEGCNKMICNNCGQYFCYRCNKAIDGYDHYREGTCELFPQEAIQQWEEQMNIRQVIGQMHAEFFVGYGQPCPNCGQFNAKVGNNNHILCWSCQIHFCYLCKKVVKRSSQHYGPKGCKQHTVD